MFVYQQRLLHSQSRLKIDYIILFYIYWVLGNTKKELLIFAAAIFLIKFLRSV